MRTELEIMVEALVAAACEKELEALRLRVTELEWELKCTKESIENLHVELSMGS